MTTTNRLLGDVRARVADLRELFDHGNTIAEDPLNELSRELVEAVDELDDKLTGGADPIPVAWYHPPQTDAIDPSPVLATLRQLVAGYEDAGRPNDGDTVSDPVEVLRSVRGELEREGLRLNQWEFTPTHPYDAGDLTEIRESVAYEIGRIQWLIEQLGDDKHLTNDGIQEA